MRPFFEPRDSKVVIGSREDSLHFGAHFHKHIEFVYLKSGKACVTLDGEEFIIRAGECFIAFPNQIHSYRHIAHHDTIMILVTPDVLYSQRHTFYSYIPQKCIAKMDETLERILYMFLDDFNGLNSSVADYDGSNDNIYICYAQLILSKALEKFTLVPVKDDKSNVLKSVIKYCREHYKEKISLDIVASELNVSKYYLSHIFSDKINISFPDYINSLRAEEAMRLLDETKLSTTEIADRCGFNTVRTFNRAFKRCNNISPREYRKRALLESYVSTL